VYDVVKDFATPVASLVAAAMAAWFAWRLGRGQMRIAEEQAQVAKVQARLAEDRLRFDQFDKRYKIFDAVRQLIQVALYEAFKKEFVLDSVTPLYLQLHEAPLFFSKETCDFIDSVRKDCQRLIGIARSGMPPPPPIIVENLGKLSPEERAAHVPEGYLLMERLTATLDELPNRFIPELGLGRPMSNEG
jgi:hypothetical protein